MQPPHIAINLNSWLVSLLLLVAYSFAPFHSTNAFFLRESYPFTKDAKSLPMNYASSAAASDGPMSQVDSNKAGGCPFLDKSYEHKTYAVPALFSEEDSRSIILFDGECNLCNKFVQTLLKLDVGSKDGNLRFAALQSRVGELLLKRMSPEIREKVLLKNALKGEEKYKSVVVCGHSETYINSSAVLKIVGSLDGPSKRLKALQSLALVGYVLPNRLRDKIYVFVSKRRGKWFGNADECMLWDERFETRFVDDGILTGALRDPFADPNAKTVPTSVNLFEGDSLLARGDKVRIIWPADSTQDPSVSYDDEFSEGICLVGGTGTISTIDLPMRVVMRVDRSSIGLSGVNETIIAWVKPQEIATLD